MSSNRRRAKTREETRAVQPADEGVGPLLQRDYLLTLEGSPCTPERAVEMVRADFPRFSPDALGRFTRPEGEDRPLEVGDTLHVRITGSGHAAVLVTHRDARSITLSTLVGHLEAGRNTVGAYRDRTGRLVCHIRSRFRIKDYPRMAAYWLGGKAAQTTIWVTFLKRLADACGGQVVGEVRTSTSRVAETPADRGEERCPTFLAQPEMAGRGGS